MLLFQEIDDTPKQQLTLVDENGNNILFTLYFYPTQSAWFFDLSYGNFQLNGCRLVNSINILKSYKNQLPFGIACLSNDGSDPFMLNDFLNSRCQIYTLTPNDLVNIKGFWGY
jgi:hypothetical protein